MPTLVAVPTQCPKCGGQGLWDNRLTKKNPKQPDFKCKNRACDGAIWPPKNGEVYADYAANAPAQAPIVNNPGNGAALSHGQLVTEKLNEQFAAYDLCFSHSLSLAVKASAVGVDVDLSGVARLATALFIRAGEKGLI